MERKKNCLQNKHSKDMLPANMPCANVLYPSPNQHILYAQMIILFVVVAVVVVLCYVVC